MQFQHFKNDHCNAPVQILLTRSRLRFSKLLCSYLPLTVEEGVFLNTSACLELAAGNKHKDRCCYLLFAFVT